MTHGHLSRCKFKRGDYPRPFYFIMAKYKKLAIAPDGRIVSRETGRVVSGEPELRNNRVYVKGRLYGYVAKGTKKQQEQIAKTSANRVKREKAKINKRLEEIKATGVVNAKDEIEAIDLNSKSATNQVKKYLRENRVTAEAIKKGYEQGLRGRLEISKREQSLINYGTVLEKAVNAGKLTPKQAFQMLKKMNSALDKDAQNKIWRATAKLFDKLDYKYLIGYSIDALKDIEDDFFD